MYLNTEWDGSKTAAGVVVSDGTHAFVIHPDAEQGPFIDWANKVSDGHIVIPGVFTTDRREDAETDFAGEANTAAILAAVADGTIADAPAAQYCASITFAHGKTGYLPSAGELTLAYTVIDDINACLTTIGGKTLDMVYRSDANQGEQYYRTSTQAGEVRAWSWFASNGCIGQSTKIDPGTARAFSAL